MSHLACHEWGRVEVSARGHGKAFTREQADALLGAARRHRLGGRDGTDILVDHHRYLCARQVVGVLAAEGTSLEILPKVDPDSPAEDAPTVRRRLVHMLDVAFGLDLDVGGSSTIARQDETLLEILIRLFADQLLGEVRRGLPRQYREQADDLVALRGRLDTVRQFTVHAVRPDRLACRFDALEADTPLMRVMKACVVALSRHARAFETQRRLVELRHALADIPDIRPAHLPWNKVRIDRTNRRWRSLFDLARLFLGRQWQATHHAAEGATGFALLFRMNDLFEAYVAARLRHVLAPQGVDVIAQGGLRYCLGDWQEDQDCTGDLFMTRPDILLRRGGKVIGLIDTKWKRLASDPLDRKHGVGQADVYQLMAYARLYRCQRLMLLYPEVPDGPAGLRRHFGIAGGRERLSVASVDISDADGLLGQLKCLVHTGLLEPAPAPEW